jgi:DNA-binding transcriptional MerR regulator
MGHIKASALGALNYRIYNKDDRIQLLWVVLVANATAAQLGYPTG